jgi:hypothetical protein
VQGAQHITSHHSTAQRGGMRQQGSREMQTGRTGSEYVGVQPAGGGGNVRNHFRAPYHPVHGLCKMGFIGQGV